MGNQNSVRKLTMSSCVGSVCSGSLLSNVKSPIKMGRAIKRVISRLNGREGGGR